MGAVEFGQMVEAARRYRGFSRSELGRQLGRLPESNRVFDPSAVRNIVTGGPVRLDHELVTKLVIVLALDAEGIRDRLGFDSADLWEAAGLWPPDLDAEGYRSFVGAGQAGARAAAALPSTGSNPTPSHNLYLLRHTGDPLDIAA